MLQLSFSSRHHLTHTSHNGSQYEIDEGSRGDGRALRGSSSSAPPLLLPYCSRVFCLASSVLRCAHTPRRRAAPLRGGSTSIEAAAELGQLLEGLAEVLGSG